MSDNDMIVVCQSKGQEINPVFLDSLYRDGYADWITATFIEDGCIKIQSTDEGEQLSQEDLQSILADYRDNDLYLVFGKKGVHRDCVQPFAICERPISRATTVAAFLYGNFPSYEYENSSLTSAWHFLQDYINPKLKQLAVSIVAAPDWSDTDITRYNEALNNAVGRKEFNKFVTDSDTSGLIILLANGAEFQYGNDLHKFSWGWTTNPLDYKEDGYPVKEEEVVEEPKKPSGLLRKSKPASGSEQAPNEVKAAPPVGGDGTLRTSHGAGLRTEAEPEKKPTVGEHDTVVEDMVGSYKIERRLSDGWMRPHPDLRSRNQIKKCYNAICGASTGELIKERRFVKPTTAKATALLATSGKPLKSLQDIGGAIKEKLGVKDVSPHHIPAQTKEDKKEEAASAKKEEAPIEEKETSPPWEPTTKNKIPLLSANELESTLAFMNNGMTKKMLDSSSLVIPDPKTLQSKETMLPSLCTKLDLKLLETLKYPFEFAVGLGEHNIKALAMLWNDTRWELIKRLSPDEKAALGPAGPATEPKKFGIKKAS